MPPSTTTPRHLVLLALALSACGCSSPRPSVERPNFLVIDIDTCSADRVGSTRDGVAVTPHIDALADRGVRFTQAFSQSGWTLPGLTAMLTGRYPVPMHAEGRVATWRPPGAPDLPEILRMYGYTTAAFWGATLPGPMGVAVSGSFDFVDAQERARAMPSADHVVNWLERRPTEPFLAYVHEVDLHSPDLDRARSSDIPFSDLELRDHGDTWLAIFQSLSTILGPQLAAERTVARYDAELNRYDRAVGDLLGALDRLGLAERTVVVVTSDHGEDFFQHAYGDHGLLYDSILRVPLVVYDPDLSDRGSTIDTLVQGVDLAPTLLARAGIPAEARMVGQSWMPLLDLAGGRYAERPVYSMTDACNISLRTDDHKIILRDRTPQVQRDWLATYQAPTRADVELHAFAASYDLGGVPFPDCETETENLARAGMVGSPNARSGGVAPGAISDGTLVELYDLHDDPNELNNIVREQPELAAKLLAELLQVAFATRAGVGGVSGALTAEQERALREQGYWGFAVRGEGSPGVAPPPPQGGDQR